MQTPLAFALSPVQVIGAGGHGRVVLAALRAAGWPVAALFDDAPHLKDALVGGHRVRGDARCVAPSVPYLLAVGDNAAREALARTLAHAAAAGALVHPQAHVDPEAVLAPGAFVAAGAVVVVGAAIGAHAIVNTLASVDHDGHIGAFAHVGPGARICGGVHIGTGALVGAGAVVAPGVHVGDGARIGAGAAVVRDVPPGATAVGVPARLITAPPA